MQAGEEVQTYLQQLKGKISNTAQAGGIETSVLDNGPARGTRIAWVNTGTGLRYKIVIDRAMDIADAFYAAHSLSWLSHGGITNAQPAANKGLDWLRTFFGGLLTTCGLSHVGGPESDEHGDRGIHGNISNTPAEIESICQPDPVNGVADYSITGVMKETKIFGPSLELRRTISGKLGQSFLHIHDEVMNRGNVPTPHMLLYHINFGWPLADEATKLFWKGKMQLPDRKGDDRIFNGEYDFKTCPPPLNIHLSTGEAVAFIDVETDEQQKCEAGILNESLQLGVKISFNKGQLPWLTNWQHWGYGEYVTGIEPGTHPPIGQANARKQGTLIFLEPGEKKTYDVQIDVLANTAEISNFINRYK